MRLYVVVCATISAVVLSGCGSSETTPTASPGVSVPMTVPGVAKADPTPLPASRQFTRDELKTWWRNGWTDKNGNRITTATAKAKLGPPVSTYEQDMTTTQGIAGGGTVPAKRRVTVFRYESLSVDAAGSGKADRAVLFMFESNGVQVFNPPDFIP